MSGKNKKKPLSFIDLFAGIGGFHIALHDLGAECVFVNEFDRHARATYKEYFKTKNPILFGHTDAEDNQDKIRRYFWEDIRLLTNHQKSKQKSDKLINNVIEGKLDILCAGFPCQPFSQAGHKKGFEDAHRGMLFFDIDRILEVKKPRVVFLENVRNLASHDDGYTLGKILQQLEARGYDIVVPEGMNKLGDKEIAKEYVRVNKGKRWTVLRASDFESPTYRPRIYIVAFHKKKVKKNIRMSFSFPAPREKKATLASVLGKPWPDIIGRTLRVGGRGSPHGNKHNWDSYSGTDNSRLIIGPEQGLRIMGFPEDFKFPANLSVTQKMKQLGNSVAVPVIRAVGSEIIKVLHD